MFKNINKILSKKNLVSSVFCIIITISCNKVDLIKNANYNDIVDSTKSIDKPAWVFIENNINNKFTQKSLNDLMLKKFIHEYSSDFLFYNIDLLNSKNDYLNYIYRFEYFPVLLLLSKEGEMVYYTYDFTDEVSIDSLKSVSNKIMRGNTNFMLTNKNFNLHNDTLISFYNRVMNVQLNLDNKINSEKNLTDLLKLLKLTIDEEPYFYNLYLYGEISHRLKLDSLSTHYKDLAKNYFINNNAITYTELFMGLDEGSTINTPTIDFKHTSIDLGHIKTGEQITRYLEFTNNGTSPLVVINSYSSCSCVKLELCKEPILPNKKGTIKLIYTAKREPYVISQNVIVITNASNPSTTINLKGFVEK